VNSLFSPPIPLAVPDDVGAAFRCLAPGPARDSAPDAELDSLFVVVDEEVRSDMTIEANNFSASGVENNDNDFWQNFFAADQFSESRCRCAIARHRTASSLLPSIVVTVLVEVGGEVQPAD
jgi:hypothetical protein